MRFSIIVLKHEKAFFKQALLLVYCNLFLLVASKPVEVYLMDWHITYIGHIAEATLALALIITK